MHMRRRDHRLLSHAKNLAPPRLALASLPADLAHPAMPISSSLSARLGTGPAPARWSPYARPAEPRGVGAGAGGGGGCAKACRPPLRLEPATARFLGPARKEVTSRSSCRAEAAASHVSAPTRRRRGDQESNPKPNPKPLEEDDEPPVEDSRGAGGFAFLCALAGHTQAISGISMPTGSVKLYSGSADGTVRLWDCNSGKCVDVIKMEGKVGCMISHGVWVFVGIPKSVEAWNTQTGTKLSLHGPSGLVCSMNIKDEILFAGTGDGRIMAWKFPPKERELEPVAILSGHGGHMISLSVSATRLFSGSLDKAIKVWDLKTLQCIQTLSEHKAAVTSVLCWDQKLLSCSLDKTVKVWAASESRNLQLIYTHAEEHGLRAIFGMHRAGKTPVLFCSLHNSNFIRLFDLPSFDEVGRLYSKKEVKTIELSSRGLLFTGDGAGELKVWRLTPQDEEPEHRRRHKHRSSVASSKNGH